MMPTIPLLTLLMLLMGSILHAQQPFILQISPRERTIGNQEASFTIAVSAQLGFTASVYLTATSPTLPAVNMSLSPSVISSPYTGTATLTVGPIPDGKPSTHIIIIEGKNGPVVSRDTAIVRMRGTTGWRIYTKENSPLPNNFIYGIDIDRSGTAWVKTPDGMVTFDGNGWGRMDTLHWPGSAGTDADLIGINATTMVASDSAGGMWFTVGYGTGQGLAHLHDGHWSMHPIPSAIPGRLTSRIEADGNGNIWLPTNPWSDTSLLRFDGTSWHAFTLPGSSDISASRMVAIDTHNHLWTAQNMIDGIDEYDGTYWTHHEIAPVSGLPFELHGIFADRKGHVWATGRQGAMEMYDDTMILYKSEEGGTTFPGLDPRYLAFDHDGAIWVAGINRLSRFKAGEWRDYDSVWKTVGTSGVVGLNVGVDNSIWLGTRENGLLVLDGESATLSAPAITTDHAAAILSLPHPNPASGEIALTIRMGTRGRARLALVDELGRTVALPLDRALDPGEHTVTIPTDGIPAGAYFIHLSTATGTEVRPVAIVH